MSPIKLNGSTSGFVALDAPAAAGSNTLVLPTGNGSSGQYLQTNGSGTLSWATLPSSGKILQVVNATYATEITNSSSTYADTGLTATITPTSASSKILIIVTQAGIYKTTNNTYIKLRLLRGATEVLFVEGAAGFTGSTASNGVGSASASYLDSPATTSATTYKTQYASNANNALVAIQGNNSTSTITLMEVAA